MNKDLVNGIYWITTALYWVWILGVSIFLISELGFFVWLVMFSLGAIFYLLFLAGVLLRDHYNPK